MNVLCVVAHPDDEVLGCGATLAKHALAGDDVLTFILGTGGTSRQGTTSIELAQLRSAASQAAQDLLSEVMVSTLPDNRFDSMDLLDIVQLVESVKARHKPEIVYTHSRADLNIDHRRTHEAVLTACRPLPGSTVKRLLAFEIPSSTEWGSGTFRPTVFVDVHGEPLVLKAKALSKYHAEMRPPPHPRSSVSIDALATWRGAMSGLGAAEAFELIREVR